MCLKWIITGYTTGRLWLITSGQLSIYVIIYIDHVVDIDLSEIWLHSGALLMCSREDRVGSALIRRMDAPPSHGRRLGQGATPKCPFPPYLAGASPSVFPRAVWWRFLRFMCDFKRFSPPPPLCSSFNGSASGTATPPPSPPPPLYRLAHRGGAHF